MSDPITAVKTDVDRTLEAIRRAGVLVAGGAPPPEELRALLWQVHTTSTNVLAVVEGTTPRELLERAFAEAPEDEQWRSATRANMEAQGRRLLGRDAESAPPE